MLALLVVLIAAPAAAQYSARADVERPIAAGSELDPSAAATTVEVRDVARAAPTLDDVLLEVPGARVTAFGTFGAFRSLRLRGAQGEHTTVLFADMPLEAAAGGAFDLGTIPLEAIERIEVHRGGAPTWLGVSGIGGALRLVPREVGEPGASARFSLGSYGFRAIDAVASSGDAETRVIASAGLTSSRGDYVYLDDASTPLDPSDDREARRTNAQLVEGRGFLRLARKMFGGDVELVAIALGRTGGVPGPAVQPTLHARARSTRSTSLVRYVNEDSATRSEVAIGFGHESRALFDAAGEIGLVPRAADDRALRGIGRAAIEHTFGDALSMVGVLRGEHVVLDPSDVLAAVPNAPSSRSAAGAGLEAIVRPGWMRMELRPSARLEVVQAALVETRAERAGIAHDATTLAPTFRLAAVIEPFAGLATSASIATGLRAPSMLELFGDRGYALGDTRLSPERSTSADVSAVLRGRSGAIRGAAEARVFALFVRDLIQYVRTSQFQATPANVASARVLGVELGGDATIGDALRLVGSSTWIDARTADRRLPLVPALQVYARAELRLRAFRPYVTLFADVTHVASSFADAANIVVIDGRTLVGAGAKVAMGWLDLALTVRDVGDVRGQDLLGFPLPGRAYALEATVRQ